MKYCTSCGKELNEDMQFCPYCGMAVMTSAEEPIMQEAVAEENVKKKKIKGVAIVLIVLVILISVLFVYFYNSKANTYNRFAELYNTMVDGAAKAETANILIVDVWSNSIWKTDDEETNKFTRENDGNGQFYEDFNDALDCLFSDQEFIEDLAEIYSLQSEVETLIKDLANHPKSFDEEYSDFKDCYSVFVKFTDMSLNMNGSLDSFTDDHNELDEELADKLKELDIYFE